MVSKPFQNRLTWVMVACIGLAALLSSRAVWIQIRKDPRLERMARKQFQAKVLVRPRRGAILDRNGEPLAINTEIESLAANPVKAHGANSTRNLARLLAKAVDLPYSKILSRLQESREFVWIKRHLSEGEISRLKRWGIMDAAGELTQGLFLVKESQRVYPHGELASQILGDVNVDLEGLEGIELKMDARLRGKVISVSAIKDAFGRPTFIDAVAAKDIQDGESVSLTIDASLQFSVEEELRNAIQRTGARSGNALVMNATNGEILAMASYPTFNPNNKNNNPDRKRNRLVTDGYEPGSTLKSVLLASSYANGMKPGDLVYGEKGTFFVQGKRISEAEAHEKFEWISLEKMIKVSSNIGAAKLALKLGADKYFNMLQSFGFGSRTLLGFPGEIPGRIPSRKQWQPLTLANIGFGQGILVTRMQMARAYASFLNGGWLLQPTLLKNPTDSVKQEAPRRIFSEKVAAQVMQALEGVTQEGGTGTKAALDGYRVAGKTGTAQMVEPGTGTYSRSKHIASFIGFATRVEPKLVILTTLEEPRGVYYASETAAPLFREILNAAVNRFSMPMQPGAAPRVLAHALPSPKATANLKATASTKDELRVSQASDHAEPDEEPVPSSDIPVLNLGEAVMPSLSGFSAREALRELSRLPTQSFQVEIKGTGWVQNQQPPPGKILAPGNHVKLVLSE